MVRAGRRAHQDPEHRALSVPLRRVDHVQTRLRQTSRPSNKLEGKKDTMITALAKGLPIPLQQASGGGQVSVECYVQEHPCNYH